MQLIEIRDLDGPNLLALEPVIKLEVRVGPDDRVSDNPAHTTTSLVPHEPCWGSVEALKGSIHTLHDRVGLRSPEIGTRWLDKPGHVAVFFSWEWRQAARLIAETALMAVSGRGVPDSAITEIARALSEDQRNGDRPTWVRDHERRIPIVGITGTNGKTTTTRLLAHIARANGRRVGWSSSTGVYVDGQQVLEGDYTGPTGARRVLDDPNVEIGVLETARGGILLRGLGYESNDVGVFLNVSADHLGLHGVEQVETLAEVKSVVVRVTRTEGLVVLNADDPLVLRQRDRVRAPVLLITQQPQHPELRDHVNAGGAALVRRGDRIVFLTDRDERNILRLADAPITFGGAAPHMVENLLAATGAAIGLGVSIKDIARAIPTFLPDIRSNPGRLNVFRLGGRIVVVDYAHNESGLDALLRFTRTLMEGSGKLLAIIGTAGDRPDETFQGLGRIAAEQADVIFIKENPNYLRGRALGEATGIIHGAIVRAGAEKHVVGIYPGEHAALAAALETAAEGDAISVMCVEEQLAVFRELRARGAEEWR